MRDHFSLVIPHEIWNNKALTLNEKLIFGRIYYFTIHGECGACLESNAKLAKEFNLHSDTIRKSLRKLEAVDLIQKQFRQFNKREMKLSNHCRVHFTKPSDY
jgi:DNA-binding MarR family transcriptional regulator